MRVRRLRVWMVGLLLAAYATLVFADVGLRQFVTCGSYPSPQQGASFCLDQTDNTLKRWTGSAWDGLPVLTSYVGPHAIGGTPVGGVRLLLTGNLPSPSSVAVQVAGTLNPGAGQSASILDIADTATIVEAASGTHADFMGVQIQPPVITAGAAALTNASTLKITGAPTGATNNYALWVVAGNVRFDGDLTQNLNISGDFVNKGGANGYQFFAANGATELMRLTDGGILALGTTVVTGASGGDLVLANALAIRGVNAAASALANLIQRGTGNETIVGSSADPVTLGSVPTISGAAGGELVLANTKAIRGENAAGTNTIAMISVNSSDQIVLGGNAIRWGEALVALGGGATPTLGTIGGSGPATAAQNSWMHVVDSTGASFWVPAWK